MPVTLPTSFLQEIERPWGTNPLIWLLELEVVRPSVDESGTAVPAILLRICQHHQVLTWPVSSPAGEVWYPYNFKFTPIAQSQEGDLPQMDLSVDNTARTLMPTLHAAGNRLRPSKRSATHAPPKKPKRPRRLRPAHRGRWRLAAPSEGSTSIRITVDLCGVQDCRSSSVPGRDSR